MISSLNSQSSFDATRELDEKLSRRFISLDPSGYFLIRLDQSTNEIVVEHFNNEIDELGRAIDPATGKPIPCKKTNVPRQASKIYRGRSAKEVGIKLTETDGPKLISRLDHALYLGRELQKAEACLLNGKPYIQD